jgi:hypothetical protein
LNKGNWKRINLAYNKKQSKYVNELIKQLNNSLDEWNNASRLVKSEFFTKSNDNKETIVDSATHSAKSTGFINKQFVSKFRFIKCVSESSIFSTNFLVFFFLQEKTRKNCRIEFV